MLDYLATVALLVAVPWAILRLPRLVRRSAVDYSDAV